VARQRRDPNGTRFGAGVTSISFVARLLISTFLGIPGLWLIANLVAAAADADPRPAALIVLLLTGWGLISYLVLKGVWQPSAEWRATQFEAQRVQRRAARATRDPIWGPFLLEVGVDEPAADEQHA
jgi:hypothetical protein